ncbi:hypothetical protein Tco_1111489, partial [Tanacetum coccineum]
MAQSPRSADVHQDKLCPPNKRYALMDANNKDNLLLGFTLDLRSTSNFKTTSLLQPWQTLCKMFSRCLTTRVTGYDQPSVQIMQMLNCFVNNIYVDYAELLWEGFHYSLKNPTTMIPYPRFTKLIVSHYMTIFPEISRRAHDRYHNLEDDVMIKSIFNSGKSKNVVGMKIPDWMITDRMKLTENYQLYAEVFGVDVPTTQSQPIESIQGTHRTTSAPKTPNPEIAEGESNDLFLQDTLQVSLVEQKSHKELESKQNVEKVKEHLMAEEIEKLVEGSANVEENVEVSSSPLRNDDNKTNPDTRLEPRRDKEKEEESEEDDYELRRREKGKHVEEIRNTPSPTTIRSPRILTNLVSSDTKKLQELTKTDTIPSSSTPSSSSSKLSATNRILSLFKSKPGRFKRYKSFFDELQGKYGYLFGHLTTRFLPRRKFNALARYFQDIMMESLPKMVDEHIKKILQTKVPLHVAQGIILEREKTQAKVAKMIANAIQQERENFRSEISSQVNDAITNHIPSQVDSSVRSYMSGHVLHVHPTQATPTTTQEQQHQLYMTMKDNPQLQQDDLPIWLALKYKFKRLHMATTSCRPSTVRPRYQDDPHDDAHFEGGEYEPGRSTSGNQEQSDDFDFWTNSYATNDDVLPNEKASQELVDEISQTVGEAKLCKVVDEIDIVWESKKEIIVPPYQPKPTLVVQSHQRDPKAPELPLKEHPDVEKCMKRFNPYARYGVEHWKNSHAKIFYIRNQQAPGKPKEEIYSNSKIVQIIKTYWELGHEHKFITEIVARRANGSIVSITKSDYKNLNKNDIEDMYMLIVNHKVYNYAETGLLWSLSIFISSTVIWERVHDFQLGVESYQQRVSLTASIITLLGIEKYKMFFIISELVYGIIYENNKKEKRVMRHQEIHKFCDATLKRVLEGLKSYNNDVKYGYVTHNLSKEDIEYLQLFAEEIEERLKSSEDASTNDDDDGEDDDLLVDEENEIVEHDVDVHMFDQLQCELELQVSMRKAFRFKAKTEREVRGDHSLQYAMLRYYVVKLQSTNPDTTVKIIVKRKTDPSFPIRDTENPGTTMEEYVQFETERALRNGQVFNWEISTYGKIRHVEYVHDLRFFETEFPAIVFNDALTSEPEVSSKPTVSPRHVKEVDLKIKMSFSESDDEDYTVIYDNDSFSYKIISINDLKSNTNNNDGKIDVKLSSENIYINPLDSVIEADIDTYSYTFDGDLKTNHDKPNMALQPSAKRHLLLRFDAQDYTNADIHDFEDRPDEMDQAMTDRLRIKHTGVDGQVVFTSHAWRQLFGIRGPLVRELILEFFRTCRFTDSVLDLDTADTFHIVPSYTLIKEPLRRPCHRLIAFSIAGRGMLQGGSGVLGCLEVAIGLERQQVRATAGATHVDPKVAQKGVQADLAPAEAAQMPQAADLAPRRSRFAMWMIGRMTQLMDDSGRRYQEFDGSFVGSSQ